MEITHEQQRQLASLGIVFFLALDHTVKAEANTSAATAPAERSTA